MVTLNATGASMTVANGMAIVDKVGISTRDANWRTNCAQRASMVFAALCCRRAPDTDKAAADLESETVRMLENGEWKDDFRFLGIPVIVDEAVPEGTVRLQDQSGVVVGEIVNLCVPRFYNGH